ncbi:MAG: EAL domain-containing protein [Steroidobacteraceae bacterium]
MRGAACRAECIEQPAAGLRHAHSTAARVKAVLPLTGLWSTWRAGRALCKTGVVLEMQRTPNRENEAESLDGLRALEVLDSAPEAAFDALARVASSVCHVPISLISLVDADRVSIKADVGLPGVAERFHLVSRIDRWVVKQACAWMKALPSLDMIDSLSVNLSGQSVSDRAFHAWAIDILAEIGPQVCAKLCFEITETAVVTNLADATIFIQKVRAAGVKVALDDFGADISSCGHLKTLKVDYLKIDGQFIRHLLRDSLDEAAVHRFVEVARRIGVKTVAKFVDQPEILQRLRELGVDYAQGFLLQGPAPIDELLRADAAVNFVFNNPVNAKGTCGCLSLDVEEAEGGRLLRTSM